MGLSARTDDWDGSTLPEGYIKISTSAANGLFFKNPLNKQLYMAANPSQFSKGGNNTGGFNTETALG